jgi:hypothetical protein
VLEAVASLSTRVLTDGAKRYTVNYRDPNGQGRRRTFTRWQAANAFQNQVETDKNRGA